MCCVSSYDQLYKPALPTLATGTELVGASFPYIKWIAASTRAGAYNSISAREFVKFVYVGSFISR